MFGLGLAKQEMKIGTISVQEQKTAKIAGLVAGEFNGWLEGKPGLNLAFFFGRFCTEEHKQASP